MDFVTLLNDELQRRREHNQNYSMRAFSRELSIDPSDLSKILRRTKQVGKRLIKRVAGQIGVSADDIQYLVRITEEKATGPAQDPKMMDNFRIFSSWYHLAILELLEITGPRISVETATTKLGINEEQYSEAIQNLQNAGMIASDGDNVVRLDHGEQITINQRFSKYAKKNLQKGLLGKASNSIDQETPNSTHTCTMVATSKEKIKEAQEMIEKFNIEIKRVLNSAPTKDAVANISTSLFEITKQ